MNKIKQRGCEMKEEHIDIKHYEIQGVKHWIAGISGKNDFIFEIQPQENLNQFRWRIMDTLNCGIVTHFIEKGIENQ